MFFVVVVIVFSWNFLHIIVFCSRVVVVLYLSCHSYNFVTLFFFSPLFFDLTLLPCFLYLFLFWKRFSDSGISFVDNVFSSSPYIRRPNGNYFSAFTVNIVTTLIRSTSITITEGREIGVGLREI